jgi:hypothetical protein
MVQHAVLNHLTVLVNATGLGSSNSDRLMIVVKGHGVLGISEMSAPTAATTGGNLPALVATENAFLGHIVAMNK